MVAKFQEDLKQAQLVKDETKVSTLRLLLSEIKNAEIAKGLSAEKLSDEEIATIVGREAKKRREAAEGFRKGDREESAQKEESELKVLEGYLPAQLSIEELTNIVESSINEVGVTSIQDMGKVMSVVMSKVAGKADGGSVSALVRSALVKEKLS